MNRTSCSRLCWGHSLATGQRSQTNIDLIATVNLRLLNGNDGNSFRLQPEFVQRDAKLVRVSAPIRFGLPVTYPAIASRRFRADCQS